MRLWTLHPKYLDAKGLVALWREALLAKNVLENKTKGYRHHPQLNRFKSSEDPEMAIHIYLKTVYDEALKRGYSFDVRKFEKSARTVNLYTTSGQLQFEWQHLLSKLKARDPERFCKLKSLRNPLPNPVIQRIRGEAEEQRRSDADF